MAYYLGKGTVFEKEKCKEYKTKVGALEALAKTEDGVVWDENGQVIASVVNIEDVPKEALGQNKDGCINTYSESGQQLGTVDAVVVAAALSEDDNAQQGDNKEEIENKSVLNKNGSNENKTNEKSDVKENNDNEQQCDVVGAKENSKATVVCEGTLNIRRTPAWRNDNICGRAAKGQSYYIKEIHMVEGKRMVRTIDDLYLSGEPEHVRIESGV